MKKNRQREEGQYISTFLSNGKGKMEVYLSGLKHEIRNHQNNLDDGFIFQSCKKINFIHQLGTVYRHNNYGYVCAGYFWYRFSFNDLLILSN